MEIQQKLWNYDKNVFGRQVIRLKPNKNSLGEEKKKFIEIMCWFVDSLNLEFLQVNGRPRVNIKEVIISLLVMSYHSSSYRRAESDLEDLKEKGVLNNIPKRSTLNDYANDINIFRLIEKLIQLSSKFFLDNEDTLIIDSTWFGLRMYSGGYRKVYDKKSTSLEKCRKLHIAVAKNSKIITCAKATFGTVHDSPIFRKLVRKSVNIIFKAIFAFSTFFGILG